jgi:predicted Ser/Thr protein kinase
LELFDRYITHVSYFTKGEKVRNPLTGQYEDPDAHLMEEVEVLLGAPKDREALRHALINQIAAWAIDHPDHPVKNEQVFPAQLKRMRNAVFAERRKGLAKLCRDAVVLLREEGQGLTPDQRRAAQGLVDTLKQRFSYEDSSVSDAAVALMHGPFRELLD